MKAEDKKKAELIEKLLADNPQYRDSMKRYVLEQLVDAYFIDPDKFNKIASEAQKEDKRSKKNGDDLFNAKQETKPREIVCITKIENTEPFPVELHYDVGDDGMIKIA